MIPGNVYGHKQAAIAISVSEDSLNPLIHGGQKVIDIKRMVRLGRDKLCFDRATGETELYDLVQDPGERTDVSDAHPEKVAALMATLQAFLDKEAAAEDSLPGPDAERMDALEALGY